MSEQEPAQKTMPVDDIRELWKWLLHEDTLYQQRSHIFIIIQALLFTGAVTLYRDSSVLQYLFIAVGLLIASCWLVALRHQRSGTINEIKKALRNYGKSQDQTNFFRIYYEISSARSRSFFPSLNTMIGRVIPSIFILAWVTMLCISIYPALRK